MTRLPGDHNADGVVNMADITAGLAGGSFAKVTESLANWGAKAPPVYILPLQPYIYEDKFEALAFSCGGIGDVLALRPKAINNHDQSAGTGTTYSTNHLAASIEVEGASGSDYLLRVLGKSPGQYAQLEMPEQLESEIDCLGAPWVNVPGRPIQCNHVIIRNAVIGNGTGLTPKVKPWGGDKAKRSIWFIGCQFKGDGVSPLPVVDIAEWGGGHWYHGCEWDNCQATPANANAFVDCDLHNMTSDGFHNARAVLNSTIGGIRKIDPSVHPDAIQLSSPVDPGPCCYFGVSGENLRAQGLFVRCPAIKALGIANVDLRCEVDSGYKSQLMGVAIDSLVIDGLSIAGQPLTVRNDGKSNPPRNVRIARSAVYGLNVPAGVSIDPGSGFVVQP